MKIPQLLPLASAALWIATPHLGIAEVPVRVKSITPRTDIALATQITQPAEITPYFSLDVFAPKAGLVRSVLKDLGDTVSAGDALLELSDATDAPFVVAAPFDGVVADRAVDPGVFVGSPGLVAEAPVLMKIQRSDIVSVSAAIPEPYAAEVAGNTLAVLKVSSLPALDVRAPLSRIAPQLRTVDRTLGIEFDVFNGSSADYELFQQKLAGGANLLLRGRALPFFPPSLPQGRSAGLKPGMYATVTLQMRRPPGDAVLPSSAIFRDGGMPFLFQIVDGRAVRRPVRVELDNGTHAIVRWVVPEGLRALETSERIVLTNQGELDNGTLLQDSPGEFPEAL